MAAPTPPSAGPPGASSSPPPPHSPPHKAALTMPDFAAPIPLTPLEQDIFSLLLDVAHQPDVPDVTLRVAGGWVRDKILFPSLDLGRSVDIDIALDSMLGIDFAERIKDYMQRHGKGSASVGLIQKNPDQSKHLETATMRILGVSLDLVNLRTETYSHDSRIPDVHIGTPQEDAMRRDLTINALFYNINTRQLEDFTGRGFDDIRARLIRTPLPPLTTLLDDPLRALRAIRFAARLNFSVHADLVAACKHTEVHSALAAKVSRERISTELTNILRDRDPSHAVALLVELGLFPFVIRLPPVDTLIARTNPPTELPQLALSALLNLQALPPVANCPTAPGLVRYAALLSPLAAASCRFAEDGKRLKEIPVVQYVLRVDLRIGVSDTSLVCAILKAALAFRVRVHQGEMQLDRLGTAKDVRIAGPNWRTAVRVALLTELPLAKPINSYVKASDHSIGPIEIPDSAKMLIKTYDDFMRKVDEMGLDGVWEIKPVINGHELFRLLPGLKKGPRVGKIMKEQLDWMIQNPTETKEAVGEWIKSTYSELAKTS